MTAAEDQTARGISDSPSLPRITVLLMAVATGLAVANLYYCQPLLEVIGSSLHISAGSVGTLVTLTQVGYALGLLFVLPLGDLLERRGLIVGMSFASVIALVATATAQNASWLFVASVAVGVLSVLAQVLVPLAASLAAPEERGTIVGTVMSGLLLGILLARTVAGLLAEVGGWRAVYVVAAVLMFVLTFALRRGLPRSEPTVSASYGALLASVGRLVRTEPVLRRRMLYGAVTFAQFSVLWTALTGLLSGPPYHYSELVIGLFGLVGAAGAFAAQIAGRLADRGHATALSVAFGVLLVVSWAATAFGRHDLLPLIVGIVLLDFGVQGMQVTNQSQIYTLAGDARARVNSVYMTAYFVGGALGSWVATRVASAYGWSGVCWLGGGLAVVLVVIVTGGEWSLRRQLAAVNR
ncbi:MFS transporter [Rudaeicoccus suwonensis]|uniref:MFS transporter n=1 Tax=Rudaeicoccus suwonensis TaxID=657409 RepID=UPI001FEA5FAF|nr:MFS transporter [Rudaeicoccus suwonensis]